MGGSTYRILDKKLVIRITFNVVALVLVLFAPWWIFLLGATALVLMSLGVEIVAWGFLFDVIYGPLMPSLPVPFLGTIAGLVLFVVARNLKDRLYS